MLELDKLPLRDKKVLRDTMEFFFVENTDVVAAILHEFSLADDGLAEFSAKVEALARKLVLLLGSEPQAIKTVEFLLARDLNLSDSRRIILYSFLLFFTGDVQEEDLPSSTENINQEFDKKLWLSGFLSQNSQLSVAEVRVVEAFIEHRVTVKVINGVNVLLVTDDHSNYETTQRNESASQAVEIILGSQNTSGVLVEYFPQELKENASKNVLVRNALKGMRSGTFGAFLKKYHDSRFESAVPYLDHANAVGKPVWVADTANKITHELAEVPLLYSWWVSVAVVALAGCLSLAPSSQEMLEVEKLLELLSVASSAAGYLELFFKPLFFKLDDMMPWFEAVFLQADDARRIRVARAIGVLTADQQVGSTLLVVYPDAHLRRIRHYLEHPEFAAWKDKIYKTVLFWLDYELRTYRFDAQQNLWNKNTQKF